jgi:hypothetical protein
MNKKNITPDTLNLLKAEYKYTKILIKRVDKNTLKYNNRIKTISNALVDFKQSLIKNPI